MDLRRPTPISVLVTFFLSASTLAQTALTKPPTSQTVNERPSVILIVTEGLTLDDLEDPRLTALYAFARTGSVGLMSVSAGARKSDSAALLALATGSPLPTGPADGEAYLLHERHREGDSAAVVFRRRTTNPLPTTAEIDRFFPYSGPAVHLGIASLTNRKLNGKLIGSWLGDRTVAVCGNADSDSPHRSGALFATNSQGWITDAFIGRESLDRVTGAPYGRTDSPELLAAWALSRRNADLVVIQMGDLLRAESAKLELSSKQYSQARRHAMERLNRLLASLSSRANARNTSPRILLVSSRPYADGSGQRNRLSLAVLGGRGSRRDARLLTSASTRTPGLISHLDIAPAILHMLARPRAPHMTGHTLVNVEGSRAELHRIDTLTRVNARGLDIVFVTLGVIATIVGLGGLLAVKMRWGAGFAGFLFLALSNFPLGMLLLVPLYPKSVSELGVCVGALILALAVLECVAGLIVHRHYAHVSMARAAVVTLAAMTAGTILIDAVGGQPMAKYSLFSSGQVTGIRFYGIGNEYMGVVVGMTLLLAFLAELRLREALILFTITTVVLGAPALGADAGGFVTSIVAFGLGILIMTGRDVNWVAAVILTIIGFAGAFGLAFADSHISGSESSHLGAAIQSAAGGGWQSLLDIIWRKARMNVAILLRLPTLAAVAGAILLIVLLRWPLRQHVQTVMVRYPGWTRGVPAALWGSLAAFLFNDSGAVPAIFITASFLASAVILLFFESQTATTYGQ